MIGILIAVLVAALVWAICVALGLPAIVGIVAAILVLLAGIPSGGYGLGGGMMTASRFAGSCFLRLAFGPLSEMNTTCESK